MDKKQLLQMGLSEEQAEQIFQENQQEINKIKIDFGVQNILSKNKAKNIKAVSALLDYDNILDEEGSFSALEEQISKLKANEETAFLFDNHNEEKLLKGAKAEEGKDRGKPKNLRNMTYKEMCKYMD